jgi:hypothetical protein
MSLMDAPVYNETRENAKKKLLIGSALVFAALLLLTLLGYILGHGWLFTNLPVEHRVNNFFNALEAKDYGKAFDIYTNDPTAAQHPERHSEYPLARFTQDWTADSPVNAPITSHHVDISRTDGSGTFGSGIIVAVRVNGNKKLFMYYLKKTGELTEPAPHILEY